MPDAIRTLIGETFGHLEAQVTVVLPKLLAAALIVLLGALIGFVIERATNWLLRARHIDRAVERLGLARSLETLGITSFVRTLGIVARWVVILLASVTALNVLDGRLAGELMRRLVLYLPELAVAVVIVAVGSIVARYISRAVLIAAVNNELPSARLLSTATRISVMIVASAVAFEEAGIGRMTILVGFGILFGGIVLAAALCLGLGTQDIVRHWVSQRFEAPEPKEKWARLQHW
jgi:putative Mn2+ efflux pump MntP